MKYLLFSHGFGVKKDSRGMFSEIANSQPGYKPVMFDYNRVKAKKSYIDSYSAQAIKLKKMIDSIISSDKSAVIVMIAHSQGCIMPCLLQLPANVQKVILLAPPIILATKKPGTIKQGTRKSITGNILIPRKDGTTTVLTRGFLKSIQATDPIELYKRLGKTFPVSIISAKQDEMIANNGLSKLSGYVKLYSISGDHNFTGYDRQGLIKLISKILN